MIKISKLADYAVVILAAMGQGDAVRMSATSLSATTNIPEPTVSKILKILSRHNIIVSARGVNGGYTLSRPITQITMRDVIAAIDGPIAITSCADGHLPDCSLAHTCGTRGRWDHVNSAITNALEQVSLADMIHSPHKSASNMKENHHGCY